MFIPLVDSTVAELEQDLVHGGPVNPAKIRHLLETIWHDGYAHGQNDSAPKNEPDDIEEWWSWHIEDREEIDL